MDFNFTEEQLLLKEMIRSFCKKELPKKYVRELDETTSFIPDDLWNKLADIGYMGLKVPREYGGGGMSFMDSIIACEELATASTAVAFCAGLSQDFGGDIINKVGTKAQKDYYLPKVAEGKLKSCLALTEPGGGTDVLGAMKSVAEKKGDRYIINGQKVFITGAHVADIMLIVAITDTKTEKRHKGLTVFIADAKSKGISVVPIRKLGVHGCGANEIFMENVEVAEENILGGVEQLNKGWQALTDIMNPERIVTATFSLGIAHAAFADAKEYALQRYALRSPSASS